ncbi:MAG: RNA methyltransferase [Bacteroidota bacterium]
MKKLKNSQLERKTIDEFKQSKKLPVVIILDNIRSLNNIGSVFRSSDAFLIKKIFLCGITATPPHRDIHKTALGATDSVEWEYFEQTEDAIRNLRDKGYTIISIEQADQSVKLPDFKPEKSAKYALVFGHEVKGVQQKIVSLSDLCLEIPQYGTKHSFNISVSAGIILYHFYYHFSEDYFI